MRDYLLNALIGDKFDLPVVPLKSESGYFVLLDVSKCRDKIPDRYIKSHDFEDLKEG